jgi:undecaprenyl-diphosphatase
MYNLPDWLSHVILGTLQGLTEFLPVSSSGHLLLAEKLLGYSDSTPGLEILLHVATLAAVLWVYRNDLLRIVGSLFSPNDHGRGAVRDRALLLWLILGTIPVVIIALPPVKDIIPYVEFAENLKNQPWAIPAIAFALLITGLLMFILDRLRSDDATTFTVRSWRSVFIGIAQCVALMPGISRSGSTLFTGVLLGLNREDAARYSFLLSVPAILGALILKWDDVKAVTDLATVPVLCGVGAAFLSGILAINWLVTMLVRSRVYVFAIWTWLVAISALVYYYFYL